MYYQRHHVIAQELDEFGEVTFIDQGTVAVGFEVNKKHKFIIKYENKCIIGAFGISFGQRSRYIYKTLSICKGYFIRKQKWFEILMEKPEISKVLKQNILIDFIMNVRCKAGCGRNMII